MFQNHNAKDRAEFQMPICKQVAYPVGNHEVRLPEEDQKAMFT